MGLTKVAYHQISSHPEDANDYADSLVFNSSTGTITLSRTGNLSDLSTTIDGRYATTAHSHALADLSITGTASSTAYLRGDGVWASFPDISNIAVSGDNLSRGQLLEEITADDGQDRFVINNTVTSNTSMQVTGGTEGSPSAPLGEHYSGNVSANQADISSGDTYFFSFPTSQYNEGDHISPQPNFIGVDSNTLYAISPGFWNYNGNTFYYAGWDASGAKWGKQEMGTGCKITWSLVPANENVMEWEYGEGTSGTLTSLDWVSNIGFDPSNDIQAVLQEWGDVSGLSFYEVPFNDSRRTGVTDLDFAHINIFCIELDLIDSTNTLGHVTDFPGIKDTANPSSYLTARKRSIDSSDIAIDSRIFASGAGATSGLINFRNVFKHEIGHSLGLAHTHDTGTIMYPIAFYGIAETPLSNGEKQGVQTIYGLPLSGTQSTVFRTTKDTIEKDTLIVEHDFVSIGTTYDDTQLLVKGKVGVNTIFPQYEMDIAGTVRATTVLATSFSGDGSALTGIDEFPAQLNQSEKFLTTNGSSVSWFPAAKTFNQTTAPTTGFSVGDIWYDTDDGVISIAGLVNGSTEWIAV